MGKVAPASSIAEVAKTDHRDKMVHIHKEQMR